MSNAPYDYQQQMLYTSSYQPSTVHIRNTGMQRYFRKYFLEKAIGRFEFTLPGNWDRNYFLYTLFYYLGYVSIVNTDKFGVIPQAAGLQGYNVFYAPNRCVISNPLLRGILQPRIGIETELIRLQYNYTSISDIINFYADFVTICYEALEMNVLNSKFAYVFVGQNKNVADSFKVLFDEIQKGNPAVVADKKLLNSENELNVHFINNDISKNFIANDLYLLIKKIETEFESEIGLNNANTEKKERLIVDEVNANNESTQTKAQLWLECIQDGMEKVRKMFSIPENELNVKFRKMEVGNNGNNNDIGALRLRSDLIR